jgi:hypothetical protein
MMISGYRVTLRSSVMASIVCQRSLRRHLRATTKGLLRCETGSQ